MRSFERGDNELAIPCQTCLRAAPTPAANCQLPLLARLLRPLVIVIASLNEVSNVGHRAC